MTDVHALIGDTFDRLAGLLESGDAAAWDAPSLCEGWRVREVVSHVTMPARMSEQDYGTEIAAFGGDFQAMSDHVAARDAALSVEEHLAHLRSPTLAAWEPPGGGEMGALNHTVIHSLDVTNALGAARPCDDEAARLILDSLTEGGVARVFGVDPEGLRLTATDLDWQWGEGRELTATSAELASMLCHRTLSDGRTLLG